MRARSPGAVVAAAALAALVVAAPGRARAEGEKIVAIEVIENTKTSAETVELIAHVDVGDTWTWERAEQIKIDLQSCGLFQAVDLFTTPVGGGIKLTITAKDKFSWIVAPTFYTQPGNVGGGIGYGENNLFGNNKKLLLYAQIATGETFFFGVFLDPAIRGSRFFWRVDTYLRHANVTEFDSPGGFDDKPQPARITRLNYLDAATLLGMNLWRGVSVSAHFRVAYVFYGETDYADGYDAAGLGLPPVPVPPEVDGWDTSFELSLSRDDRANWNGVFSGTSVGVGWERSIDALSAYDYWSASAHFEWDKKIWDTHNFIVRVGGNYGWHLPFQQEFTSGGVNLRGYENNQFRGDFKLSGRLEYSFQLFWTGPLAWRALGFWDTAYTSFLNSDGNVQRNYLPNETNNALNRWRNGVGGGLRVYVKSIVLPLLGVDVGYGVEVGDYHVYLAVGLTNL
jgi:outer membrane protein insertion porin family